MDSKISWKEKLSKVLIVSGCIAGGIFVLCCIGFAIRGWYLEIVPKEPHYVWGPVADKYAEIRKHRSVVNGVAVFTDRYTYCLDLDVTDDSEQIGKDDRGDGSAVMKFQVSKGLYQDVRIGDFVILDDANNTMDWVAAEDWADYTRAEMDELVREKYNIEE